VETSTSPRGPWVGSPVPRREDPALLTGHARFIDDLSPLPGLTHAAILRLSPAVSSMRGA
jgi:carbon-monoxide dehydrogenase large subunit